LITISSFEEKIFKFLFRISSFDHTLLKCPLYFFSNLTTIAHFSKPYLLPLSGIRGPGGFTFPFLKAQLKNF